MSKAFSFLRARSRCRGYHTGDQGAWDPSKILVHSASGGWLAVTGLLSFSSSFFLLPIALVRKAALSSGFTPSLRSLHVQQGMYCTLLCSVVYFTVLYFHLAQQWVHCTLLQCTKTCPISKVGGLHLDLRALATVQLVETRESPTGWAAQLGPGATWAQVWGHTVHLYTQCHHVYYTLYHF